MAMKPRIPFSLILCALLFSACQQQQLLLPAEKQARLERLEARMDRLESAEIEPPDDYKVNTYPHFVSRYGFPRCMAIFHLDDVMATTTVENAYIVICLSQQRGRLYVNGQVAADWPVSTGVEGRATSLGEYKVLEKKKEHASRRFGVIRDAAGNTLMAEADSRKHTVPEGATWVGSPMPNWMRLTDYGMGMHTGVVEPGTCLSHGCIRMPDFIASRLFELVEPGFVVRVTDCIEPEFPAMDALEAGAPFNAWYNAHRALQKEIDALKKSAVSETEATPAPHPLPAESAANATEA